MSRELKLRNKETGEIRKAEAREDGIYLYDEMLTKQWWKYDLALLAKFWEFYKEPERYYYIDRDGHIVETQNTRFLKGLDNKIYDVELAKSIGNIFTTQEEAETAVEKLKAWKRLKDAGFKFTDWCRDDVYGVSIQANELHDCGTMGMIDELNLLFGGEK